MSERKGKCYISVATGFLLTILCIAIAVGVGVLVYFVAYNSLRDQMLLDSKQAASAPGTSADTSEEDKYGECKDFLYARKTCLNVCPEFAQTTPQPGNVDTSDVRIPSNIIPLHYNVELKPDIYGNDPARFTFSGSVTIFLQCVTPADVIIVHSNELIIPEEGVTLTQTDDGSGLNIKRTEFDTTNQFFKVYLADMLIAGRRYSLDVSFSGILKPDIGGLYYSSYKHGDETRYLATTQMQPTDARRTFPCYDEPAIKATFNVTLLRKSSKHSLSNMDKLRTEDREDGWQADVFRQSVKMSTYLLAFVVSDLVYKEKYTSNNRTLFRVWTRPELKDQVDFSLEFGTRVLEYYEEYFGVPYPLPKQDMVAIPGYYIATAMENWGLIVHREDTLMYDPTTSSLRDRDEVLKVMAHEISHQWFGNLLSPAWWDDLWLNEGFASYMEYVGSAVMEPDWEKFASADLHGVLQTDSLADSHPIYAPVNHPDEIIEIFDVISYKRGASMIRMMSNFIGEDTFRAGLTRYFQRNKYGSADHADLWKALHDQAGQESKDLDVSAIMDTWTLQMGYPVVTVTRDVQRDMADVMQQHFLADPTQTPTDKYPSPYSYKWTIPFTYATSQQANESTMVWMEQGNVQLYNLDPDARWILGNIKQYGYYRVNYDDANWQALLQQLTDNHQVIPVMNRGQLIDDAFNLGRSGLLDQLMAFELLGYLDEEVEYIPWKAAAHNLDYVVTMLSTEPTFGMLMTYVRQLFSPMYDTLSWDYDAAGESHGNIYLRELVLKYACLSGHEACLSLASSKFRTWMNNPESNQIAVDLRYVVYCYGIQQGGQTEWDFAFDQYKKTNSPFESLRLLQALGCNSQPWILNRYLRYGFTADQVPPEDASHVVIAVSNDAYGQDLAWDFFQDNWDVVEQTFPPPFTLPDVINSVTNGCRTRATLRQLEAFRAEQGDLGPATRAINQAIERCQANIQWLDNNGGKIGQWLEQATSV